MITLQTGYKTKQREIKADHRSGRCENKKGGDAKSMRLKRELQLDLQG